MIYQPYYITINKNGFIVFNSYFMLNICITYLMIIVNFSENEFYILIKIV